MKRPLLLAMVLLALDQGTKYLAQFFLYGSQYLLAPGWGFTYVLNPGIYIKQDLPPEYIPVLQVLSGLVCLFLAGCLLIYHRYTRRSVLVDLAYAFLLASVLGNMFLDRFLAGGARDFLITPIAVANLADLYASLGAITIGVELWVYPPARHQWLRFSPPGRCARDARFYCRFLRHALRQRVHNTL